MEKEHTEEMLKALRDYRPVIDGPTRYHGGRRRRLAVRTSETAKHWNWMHHRMRRLMEVVA